jgi:hypothetical protein
MNPALSVVRIDLYPDMVLGVPDPPDSSSKRPAKHTKTVRPLSATTLSCLNQNESIVVPSKTFEIVAVGVGTFVKLNLPRASVCFLLCGFSHPYPSSR